MEKKKEDSARATRITRTTIGAPPGADAQEQGGEGVPIATGLPQAGPEADVPAEWSVGDLILDLYEVRQVFTGGNMGLVYRVHHWGWKVDLAVKSPRPEILARAGGVESFVREAELWVNLGLHPHIMNCYYVRTLGGIPRVFVEYVEGGSLSDWIGERRLYAGGPREALERIMDVAIQVAWGLHYAHEQGLVHQDVKPANVMLTPEGVARVTDFGLSRARAAAGEVGMVGGGQSILVSAGGMAPAYCSPEQAEAIAQAAASVPRERRPRLSRKTDIWSWGVSVLEMFVGEVTWRVGQAAPEALEGYLEAGHAEANIPRMPGALAELLRRCFQKDPADRPKNMLEVTAGLQEIYQLEVGRPYPREAPKPVELKADSLNNRAITWLDLGREEESIRCWQEALREDPHHLEATFNYGYWRWLNGEILGDVYLAQMGELERNKGAEPDYWRCLAWIHLERGDIEALERIQESEHRVEDGGFKKALEDKDRPVGKLLRSLSSNAFKGHTRGAFSPDGCYVLSWGGMMDKTLRLWEVTGGKELKRFEGHTRCVTSASFSPDGRCVLSGSEDGTLRLWKANGREIKRFEGHTGSVTSVSFSPDGHYALSGSWDETVRLWEVPGGKEMRRFEGHTDLVRSVSFSPDGRHVLSLGIGGTLKLWAVESGENLSFKGHTGCVRSVSFSPDSCYVLSGSEDGTLRLWEIESGKELRQFVGHTDRVESVSFSPDGQCALSGGGYYDRTARLWELASGKELRRFEGHIDVTSVSFSPDGLYARLGGGDGALRLWEVAGGKDLRRFERHTRLDSVSFSLDGRYALAGSDDENVGGFYRPGTVELWEVYYPGKDWGRIHIFPLLCRVKAVASLYQEIEKVKRILESARDCIERGSFREAYYLLREGQSVVGYERDREIMSFLTSCGKKGNGRRISLKGGWPLHTLGGHSGSVTSVSFSPDGCYALSGSWDKTVRLWEVASGRELRQFLGHTERVWSVNFSPDGRYALSGSWDETVRLWEVASGRELRRFEGHTGMSIPASFSPDGRYVLSGGETVRLWEIANGRELRQFEGHTNSVTSVSFSPDGCYALSGSWDETVRLWEVASGRELRRFEGHTGWVYSVSFSPDGCYALSGSGDIRLWEVESGRELRQFEGHTERVCSVCFSPDGRYILSGGADCTVRLWEMASGREVRLFEGHVKGVISINFSPDGRYALSGSDDQTVRLWEFDWEWEFPGPAVLDEGTILHTENVREKLNMPHPTQEQETETAQTSTLRERLRRWLKKGRSESK